MGLSLAPLIAETVNGSQDRRLWLETMGKFLTAFHVPMERSKGFVWRLMRQKISGSKGSKCLVGRLGVPKKINREPFKNLLSRIWRMAGEIFFKEIYDNLWLFKFAEDGDRRKVLEGRPWSYDRTILIVEELDD
jgi:hypothetical protein